MRFLLVDDNESYLRLMSAWCNLLNMDFDAVSSGIEAISLLESTKYSVVLTDLYMPEMSGFKLYQKIIELYDCVAVIISAEDCICTKCPIIKHKYRKPNKIEDFIKLLNDIFKREKMDIIL